jgi:hypothetical protein
MRPIVSDRTPPTNTPTELLGLTGFLVLDKLADFKLLAVDPTALLHRTLGFSSKIV